VLHGSQIAPIGALDSCDSRAGDHTQIIRFWAARAASMMAIRRIWVRDDIR
jgi:hypothetical protein